jgi:hypothetical protein
MYVCIESGREKGYSRGKTTAIQRAGIEEKIKELTCHVTLKKYLWFAIDRLKMRERDLKKRERER